MELTRETVEQLLDLPIDGTVKVNMTGLKETVDAVGGIDVNVPFPFTYDGVRFERGTMHLDGKEALAFVRMRKADPLGDLGRIKRQQAVIRALIRKGSGLNSLPQWPIIMSRLGDHVKTDLPPLTFLRLQMWLSGIEEDEIRTVQLPGRGIRWRGLYYFHPDEGGLRQVREKLKRQLEP
jgi:anionic cell wall polymer biosynthesis LytR-Cps2A-Psr (LCP) family protein